MESTHQQCGIVAVSSSSGSSGKPSRRKREPLLGLIVSSLRSAGPRGLVLAGIYKYVADHSPDYSDQLTGVPATDSARIAWRKNVRHILSVRSFFIKTTEQNPDGRGRFWTLDELKYAEFMADRKAAESADSQRARNVSPATSCQSGSCYLDAVRSLAVLQDATYVNQQQQQQQSTPVPCLPAVLPVPAGDGSWSGAAAGAMFDYDVSHCAPYRVYGPAPAQYNYQQYQDYQQYHQQQYQQQSYGMTSAAMGADRSVAGGQTTTDSSCYIHHTPPAAAAATSWCPRTWYNGHQSAVRYHPYHTTPTTTTTTTWPPTAAFTSTSRQLPQSYHTQQQQQQPVVASLSTALSASSSGNAALLSPTYWLHSPGGTSVAFNSDQQVAAYNNNNNSGNQFNYQQLRVYDCGWLSSSQQQQDVASTSQQSIQCQLPTVNNNNNNRSSRC